jgi:chromosomal replication initiator protein
MPNEWQSVFDQIKSHVSEMAFKTYCANLKCISFDNKIFKISAPNIFIKQQIEGKYREQIMEAIKASGVDCEGFEVEIEKADKPKENRHAVEIVSNEPIGRQAQTQNSPSSVMPARKVPSNITHSKNPRFSTEDSGLNPMYLLSNYVVGSNNDYAMSAAQAIVENPGTVYNPLFLYGGPGVGKTHLAQGIGNEIKRRYPEMRVLYTTIEQFYSDFVTAMKNKISGFADKYRNLDVLIVDDFQYIVNKKASQDEFFHTFNELYQHNKQVIVTSDRLPSQIETVDPRLASRLMMGMPIDIQMPDFETRCAIIKLKAEFLNADIDDPAVEFLARNIQTNIREIEGQLQRVLLLAEVRGVKPSELLLGEAATISAPQIQSMTSSRVIQPRKVVDTVSGFYGLDVEDLLGTSRRKEIKTARQIAMYLMSKELSLSTVKIGNEFKKDHTTVMHGIEVIENSLKTDFNLRSQMTELREKIYA